MGLRGLEPPTLPLSGARSSQLSYKPEADESNGAVFRVNERGIRVDLDNPEVNL